MIKVKSCLSGVYFASSFALSFFCLHESFKLSHDQRARDLAGKTIHLQENNEAVMPLSTQQAFQKPLKKIGEGSD